MFPWVLRGSPLEVQTRALDKANLRQGFAYFMEMGLGKTPLVLNEFMYLFQQGEVDGLVVLCPQSLKGNWLREARAFIKGDVVCAAWPDLPPRKRLATVPWILTMNYESMSVGGAKGYQTLQRVLARYRVYIALDESTHIKNYKATRTKNITDLSKEDNAVYRRVLSGEPVVQSPFDLWPQLRFCGARLGNPIQFRNYYCVMGGFKGKQFRGVQNQEELSQLLNNWSFIAKKKDWTDIPEKSYTTRDIELPAEQMRVYRKMEEEFYADCLNISGEPEMVEVELVITKMMKLQQLSSGFILDADRKAHRFARNPKLESLMEEIESASNKVLVFCIYRESVSILIDAMTSAGVKYSSLVGGMTTDEIEEQKILFNQGDHRVFIIQSDTGRYGHTLLGNKDSPCHTSIFWENNYNLDTRIQCEDRNHRIGQSNPVLYIDFNATAIERAAIQALQAKKDVARAVIRSVQDESR